VKRALVIGCAQNVWKDVLLALRMCDWDHFYLINWAGCYWQGQKAFTWVTLHPELMSDWQRERKLYELHANYDVVIPLAHEVGNQTCGPGWRRASYKWPKITPSGSSGLFAVKVAIGDGNDRVVLAGVPMTNTPHFGSSDSWRHADAFRPVWMGARAFYADKTRSISGGWTEKLLGRPTQEWLAR
jgi:hypothetical protein